MQQPIYSALCKRFRMILILICEYLYLYLLSKSQKNNHPIIYFVFSSHIVSMTRLLWSYLWQIIFLIDSGSLTYFEYILIFCIMIYFYSFVFGLFRAWQIIISSIVTIPSYFSRLLKNIQSFLSQFMKKFPKLLVFGFGYPLQFQFYIDPINYPVHMFLSYGLYMVSEGCLLLFKYMLSNDKGYLKSWGE